MACIHTYIQYWRKSKHNIRSGFTLAEVLVTLAIIGIVSALTIPALITSTRENQYKTSFKKTFNIITQATSNIKLENSSLDAAINAASGGDLAAKMRTLFCTKLNCIKQYGWNQQGNCAANERWELDGDNAAGSGFVGVGRPCAILADGTTLNFNWQAGSPLISWIAVDTNGKKKPNIMGEDVFLIQFETNDRVVPAGYSGGYYALNAGNGQCVKNVSAWYSGFSCATKVLTDTNY